MGMCKSFVTVILACVACVANAADYEYLYTNSRGDELFIETDSMTENTDDDRIMQAWVLMNLKKPTVVNNRRAQSMYVQYEVDCHENMVRMLKGIAYSKRDLEGVDVGGLESSDTEYRTPTRGSSEQKIMKWVCE